ncbi:MAG: RNA-splicing ligase RtcB [candidate division Zixibacteria bacterium CG_4_9_14_3_um_filter_46_8]|nr:MAG: RNA-splicing ligase RtcB [candidate division Zixibacteria bacterium CG_4_9_14_3_um_filter_46_8]
MKYTNPGPLIREIPVSEKQGMRVPARLFGSTQILNAMDDGVYEQVTNVACLPGIKKYAYCMPDGHQGYGFPIGGVAAFDLDEGVISPGGIGFDINCGVRLIKTNLTEDEIRPKLKDLIELLFHIVPTGVGKKGIISPSKKEFAKIMVEGASWCKSKGYATGGDLECIEDRGCLAGADPGKISDKAWKRGIDQIGTLGSGNHYLEIQKVGIADIFDQAIAQKFGFNTENQIAVMVHCGSRGFGHQVATDYLVEFTRAMNKYGFRTGDRELACAPFNSPEGRDYFAAMACAANTAFVNRQVITHRIREAFSRIFDKGYEQLGMNLVFDVAHNIAKIEEFKIDGKKEKLLVHRKGATRSLGPSSTLLPERFRGIGQPVLVGGSMQAGSYLLVGMDAAEELSFNSTVHGAGRTMSRTQAKKKIRGQDLLKQMNEDGIMIRTASFAGLAEEAGFAYKDIDQVVESVALLGISKPVLRLRPLGNIKG